MASDLTPEDLRRARFRSVFRGFDPAEVEATLGAAAAKIDALQASLKKLEARAAEAPSRDMSNELEALGQEVTAILQTARDAAEAMRERATLDAARWRSEAMEEADAMSKSAAADAEAMRRDAWVSGTELLEQSARAADAMRASAERDVLTVMGEAEREAHRLTSGARRESEDLIRNATMEAEKLTADATKRRDEIIDAANRQSASAQERTRALEQRRDELLEELENVRSTLTRLEGSLAERREALDLKATEPSSVKVVHPPSDAEKQWALGETVRVVPPDKGEQDVPEVGLADEVSDQVAHMQEPGPEPIVDPEPVSAGESDQAPDAEAAPMMEPEPEPEPSPVREDGDLAALFAALRTEEVEPPAKSSSGEDREAEESDQLDATDWLEIRESKLLPITNRALRGVKKAITEVQNVALDSLRTDEAWRPADGDIAEMVHAEIVAVWSESFAAGHSVAEQMADSKLKRPPTPASQADDEFAAALAQAVGSALDRAGDGARERQAAASRVFRVWRTDEAERRIREIALRGYESGLDESRKVTTTG